MNAKRTGDCWRGVGDAAPFVPGLPAVVPAAASLSRLFAEMVCCTRCELAKARTQVVVGVGDPHAPLLFVGEAPGKQEDLRGRPFVGQAGRLFDGLLEEIGFARDDVFVTNVAACRPPANRTPRASEVRAHAPWLEQQIRLVRPDAIVTLGRVALGYFRPKARITELRGRPQEIERHGRTIPLLPLLHPAAILRRRSELLPAMQADFRVIPGLLGEAGGKR